MPRRARLPLAFLPLALLALAAACQQEIRPVEDAGVADGDAGAPVSDAAAPGPDAGDDPDAGLSDAGEPPDAGTTDAGEPLDAGVVDAGPRCPEAACTGFTWCEYASGRCLPGCGNSSQCNGGTCEPDHSCSCPAGLHLCDGVCADSASPESCGTRCEPCPGAGGMAGDCVEGQCVFTCEFPAYRSPAGCGAGAWIGAGVEATCAAVGDAGVRCWGGNTVGGLGDGTSGPDAGRDTPAPASGLSGPFARVEVSWSGHACAVDVAGSLWCWGGNTFGQVGDGTRFDKYEPVPVGLADVVEIEAAPEHTCAVTGDGAVWCWGKNDFGQLGNGVGNDTPSYSPVRVLTPDSGSVLVAAGERNSCALSAAGGLKCWGTNQAGQLADGNWNEAIVPQDVPSLRSGVTHVALGQLHVCAVLETGGVKCWGFDDACGRLGNGRLSTTRVPSDVLGLPGRAFRVGTGYEHTCALLESGAVWCWGCNDYGQLGNGGTGVSTSPVQVVGLEAGVEQLNVGHSHACALMLDGRVLCWGANDNGQLGAQTSGNGLTPVEVQGL